MKSIKSFFNKLIKNKICFFFCLPLIMGTNIGSDVTDLQIDSVSKKTFKEEVEEIFWDIKQEYITKPFGLVNSEDIKIREEFKQYNHLAFSVNDKIYVAHKSFLRNTINNFEAHLIHYKENNYNYKNKKVFSHIISLFNDNNASEIRMQYIVNYFFCDLIEENKVQLNKQENIITKNTNDVQLNNFLNKDLFYFQIDNIESCKKKNNNDAIEITINKQTIMIPKKWQFKDNDNDKNDTSKDLKKNDTSEDSNKKDTSKKSFIQENQITLMMIGGILFFIIILYLSKLNHNQKNLNSIQEEKYNKEIYI